VDLTKNRTKKITARWAIDDNPDGKATSLRANATMPV